MSVKNFVLEVFSSNESTFDIVHLWDVLEYMFFMPFLADFNVYENWFIDV